MLIHKIVDVERPLPDWWDDNIHNEINYGLYCKVPVRILLFQSYTTSDVILDFARESIDKGGNITIAGSHVFKGNFGKLIRKLYNKMMEKYGRYC